ncbi:MAG TPA: hypothetical protein VK914_03400 [bacterium]|jgi:hypothetical protein|nr:hypothetical protein [bacterium]
MVNRPRNLRCPYCTFKLVPSLNPEKEHFIPKNLYVDSEQILKKPIVWSCRKCNRAKGKLDQDWFIDLALCSPPDPIYNGLRERALKSLDPDGVEAGNEKEIRIRQALRDRVSARMHLVGSISEFSPLPSLTIPEADSEGLRAILDINCKKFEEWIEYIVRGMWTFTHGSVLPLSHGIFIFYRSNRDLLIKEWGKLGLFLDPLIDLGPTIKINGFFHKVHRMLCLELLFHENIYCYAIMATKDQIEKVKNKKAFQGLVESTKS